MSTEALLTERGTTHGSFTDNARYAQQLRAIWRSSPAWDAMPQEHKEALDQMAGKFSRILSGQSSFFDHWRDLAGYASLAEKACERPAPQPLRSYDENQLDTVLRECPKCLRSYWMRPWRFICFECSGWPHVGKKETVGGAP